MHPSCNSSIIPQNSQLYENMGVLCICVQTSSATYKSVQSVVKASVYKNLRSLWVMCIMLKHWQGKPWHQRHKLSWEHWYTPFAHYQRLRAKRPRDLDHDIVYTLCTHKTWLQIHTQIWELKIDVLLGKALIDCPFGLIPFLCGQAWM